MRVPHQGSEITSYNESPLKSGGFFSFVYKISPAQDSVRILCLFSVNRQVLSTLLLHSRNLNVVLTFSLCWTSTIYGVKNNKTHGKQQKGGMIAG